MTAASSPGPSSVCCPVGSRAVTRSIRPNSPRSPILISHSRPLRCFSVTVATVSPTLLDILVTGVRSVFAPSIVQQPGNDLGGTRHGGAGLHPHPDRGRQGSLGST